MPKDPSACDIASKGILNLLTLVYPLKISALGAFCADAIKRKDESQTEKLWDPTHEFLLLKHNSSDDAREAAINER